MERFVNECVFYKGNQENDSIFKVKEYISNTSVKILHWKKWHRWFI